MLKLAGEGIYWEVIESLTYDPDLMTTGDLEAGTAAIVPTSRPAIGAAQYSTALTLAKPSDARIAVTRVEARLNVNIAGLGTATHLYCSVRVDIDDSDHELFLEDWTNNGNKLDAVDTTASTKAIIFALLANGAAHTFYFLFWADVGSQATINLVQLWEGVGSCQPGGSVSCVDITHTGLISISDKIAVVGAGSVSQSIYEGAITTGRRIRAVTTTAELSMGDNTCLVGVKAILSVGGTVATDLNYLDYLNIVLRSGG